MEKQSILEIHRVLSFEFYNTILTDLTYFCLPKCAQITEHFNAATNIINNDKIKLNISPTRFYSIGFYISQILKFPINISLRKCIIEFYCKLYEKISQNYEVFINDEYILRTIFSNFYDEYYDSNSKSGLEENTFTEDSMIRILSFKLCSQSIDRNNMKFIFNKEKIFEKIIHVFYKKSAYFFQFLIIPTVFCNIKEDACNILNTSACIFDSLESYLNIMTDLDNLCFNDKVTNDSLEKINRTIKLMFSTVLGESIHQTLLTSAYTDGIKYNLYRIISFILKFTIFVNEEKHVAMFKESVKNVTRILLKLCSIENIPSACFDSTSFTDYRSELIGMKEFLVSIQSKFNFLVITEHVQLCEKKNDEMYTDIVLALDTMEI